ncbi:MAG: GNAT family N-acetyltransferase [Cytophagales bacterium]
MQKYLDGGFAIDTGTFRPNLAIFFAVFENQAIGYLKMNFGAAQTELKDQKALETEPICVVKEFHRKSVGQMVSEIAFNLAQQTNVYYLWLVVRKQNPRAINFYKKNGFVEFE